MPRPYRLMPQRIALTKGRRKRSLPLARPQAQQMTHRVDEIGAVHGVEVKVGDAAIDEIEHLLGGNRGRDQLARRYIFVQAVETSCQPVRNRGAAARGEASGLLE